MQTTLVAICAAALAGYPSAQIPSVSLQALTQQTATVTSSTQNWSHSLPVGPLPASGSVGVSLPAPRTVAFDWLASSSVTGAELRLLMFTGADPSGSYGELGQSELLVTFSANVAAPWRLEGELWPTLTPSLGGLLFSVDIGNDGTIDWTPTTFGPIGAFGADLVTQPLVVRIIYHGATSALAGGSARLDLRVVPGDLSAVPMPTNCYNGNPYQVDPLFSPNAGFRLSTAWGDYATWQVLGFALQPTPLPITLTGTPVPCTLWPTTDWVIRTPTLFLQVPAAVRPLTIYAQSLHLFAGDLRPSDTFVITAN